jgi:hypothetical protein
VSIHADDEFSLRIALESELDDVLPSDGLAGLVIARHRKVRRRCVAGAVSFVVVCAGIGVPLGLSGPAGKAPQHNPGQRPDQHTGSVTQLPHPRAGAALIIERPAAALTSETVRTDTRKPGKQTPRNRRASSRQRPNGHLGPHVPSHLGPHAAPPSSSSRAPHRG